MLARIRLPKQFPATMKTVSGVRLRLDRKLSECCHPAAFPPREVVAVSELSLTINTR